MSAGDPPTSPAAGPSNALVLTGPSELQLSPPARKRSWKALPAPSSDWTVILHDNSKRQVVLYNHGDKRLTLRKLEPPGLPPRRESLLDGSTQARCPLCKTLLFGASSGAEDPQHLPNTPFFQDVDYFRFLRENHGLENQNTLPPASESPETTSKGLSEASLNAGYYSRFFIEGATLGRGLRGSVHVCTHVLDGVELGVYAVKKVPVGDNHTWLVRMLSEVHALGKLHHANIVEYKHAWLEDYKLTEFGPSVPVLFILQELADGNLEELINALHRDDDGGSRFDRDSLRKRRASRRSSSTSVTPDPMTNPESSVSARRSPVRGVVGARSASRAGDEDEPWPFGSSASSKRLSLPEFWNLARDISAGLAHLHSLGVIHRDLKPSNLLLVYPNRSSDLDRGSWKGREEGQMPRVLISDFGECQLHPGDASSTHRRTGATGTLEFLAPELLQVDEFGQHASQFTTASDLWALGLVLLFCWCGRLPYASIDDVDVLRREIQRVGSAGGFNHIGREGCESAGDDVAREDGGLDWMGRFRMPSDLAVLIDRLLDVDPSKRATARWVLKYVEERIVELRDESRDERGDDGVAEAEVAGNDRRGRRIYAEMTSNVSAAAGSSESPNPHQELIPLVTGSVALQEKRRSGTVAAAGASGSSKTSSPEKRTSSLTALPPVVAAPMFPAVGTSRLAASASDEQIMDSSASSMEDVSEAMDRPESSGEEPSMALMLSPASTKSPGSTLSVDGKNSTRFRTRSLAEPGEASVVSRTWIVKLALTLAQAQLMGANLVWMHAFLFALYLETSRSRTLRQIGTVMYATLHLLLMIPLWAAWGPVEGFGIPPEMQLLWSSEPGFAMHTQAVSVTVAMLALFLSSAPIEL